MKSRILKPAAAFKEEKCEGYEEFVHLNLILKAVQFFCVQQEYTLNNLNC